MLRCPRCSNSELWDRLYMKCHYCGYQVLATQIHTGAFQKFLSKIRDAIERIYA